VSEACLKHAFSADRYFLQLFQDVSFLIDDWQLPLVVYRSIIQIEFLAINIMDQRKIVCFFKYGSEDKTFLECRKNWEFYSSHHKDIMCLFFRGESSDATPEPTFDGYDYVIGENGRDFARPNKSTYSQNTNWSQLELWHGMQTWIQAFTYVVNRFPGSWIIWVNVTAFVSFEALKVVVDRLPGEKVYGGWPLFYRPEAFLYHSGSSVILSPDVARLLLDRITGYLGTESIDILWGRLLYDIPRTIIPFIQVTPEDLPVSSLKAKLDFVEQCVESGHFFFRIKNHGLDCPRHLLDPAIQMFIMTQSLRREPDMAERYLQLISQAHQKALRGHGIAVIG